MSLEDKRDILNNLSGFHQYVLSTPRYISYASSSFLTLLGYEEDDVVKENEDTYLNLVCQNDREKFLSFIEKLSKSEVSLSLEYQIVKKDGSVIYVKDQSTSRCVDSIMVVSSILVDISSLKDNFSNKIPFGFVKYTCDKQPRVTYINERMKEILHYESPKEGEVDYLELYKSNIFLTIPINEHKRFAQYLEKAYSSHMPISGEVTLLRPDGTRAYIYGWVCKSVNENGDEEFQSVCMDVTNEHKKRKESELKRYIKALCDIYEKIFEFNIASNSVKCLYSQENSSFKSFEGVAMQLDDATEKWISSAVIVEDKEKLRSFFTQFCQKRLERRENRPPQIVYRATSSDGAINTYRGVFIKLDEMSSLFCCLKINDELQAKELISENSSLKENLKDVVMRFTEGLAAFEISPDNLVTPLYMSKNISEFFGYEEDEWLSLMEKKTPLESFVAYSELSLEELYELFRKGEAEFKYYDYKNERERRIRAVCSHRDTKAKAPTYVMLYNLDEKSLLEDNSIEIRTFGYFDVFVKNRPIAFRSKKAKELFALLVDRRGGFVTSEEAISYLWEDESANAVTFSRYRKVALRLKNTLEEYGISDCIEAIDGKRRIVCERVKCDLYDYLSGREEYKRLFNGSYLSNYSWGETTLGELNSSNI